MELLNEMQLDCLSKSENESFARVAVAAFASQLDLTLDELADIKTVVSEAVTNSIIHGYEDKPGIIRIQVRLYTGRIEIAVQDWGKGIEDIQKARQPLWTSKPEQDRSGMGFTIMENFMDEFEVESSPGAGTLIKMAKNFKNDRTSR